MNNLEVFKNIKTFIFDVDGVLTNSELIVLENGQLLRKMHTRDGYAMKLAVKKGYRVCIITGGKSEGVVSRLKGLGIVDIFKGISDKEAAYSEYIEEYQITADEILFMGDDLPDYEVMRLVALPCCPSDAAPEILGISQYVSPKKGGQGCARDVIEKVLKLNGDWLETDAVDFEVTNE